MADRSEVGAGARRALAQLSGRRVNFDVALLDDDSLWKRDERIQALPHEQPGPPEADGAWAIGRRLMQGYEFADPSIVRAVYDEDAPLEGRDMLLEIRFLLLRFRVGCRVTAVFERDEEISGERAHVWGWSYRTLEGHFEQGEMHWSVAKWPETGAVAFRLQACSRRARDPNPIVRLGFQLLGRREQLRFYDSTCERMRRLTEAALRGEGHEQLRDIADRTQAHSARDTAPEAERLARNAREA